MQNPIQFQTNATSFILSIDKTVVDMPTMLKVIELLKIESLIKKVDFDKLLLTLAEELKSDWWAKNREDYLKGVNQ